MVRIAFLYRSWLRQAMGPDESMRKHLADHQAQIAQHKQRKDSKNGQTHPKLIPPQAFMTPNMQTQRSLTASPEVHEQLPTHLERRHMSFSHGPISMSTGSRPQRYGNNCRNPRKRFWATTAKTPHIWDTGNHLWTQTLASPSQDSNKRQPTNKHRASRNLEPTMSQQGLSCHPLP